MPSLFQRIQPRNLALFSLLVAAPLASSLQVTPNSPCASVCVDSRDLDFSDPNSSRTRGSDIVCNDEDLASPAGTKWKDCLSCLQTSPFSQGSESDQSWFFCRSHPIIRPVTATNFGQRQSKIHSFVLHLCIPQCHRRARHPVQNIDGLWASEAGFGEWSFGTEQRVGLFLLLCRRRRGDTTCRIRPLLAVRWGRRGKDRHAHQLSGRPRGRL